MTNTHEYRKCRGVPSRDAYQALLDLKRFIDEAACTTHDVELEAIHLAISTRTPGDIYSKMRAVLDRLGSNDIEASLHRARQSLLTAMS